MEAAPTKICHTYPIMIKLGTVLSRDILDKVFKMDQIKFVEDNLCLNRPYPFKFCKGCLPQILLGSFLNTLSHVNHPLSSTNINMENHKKWPILVVSGNTNKNYILIHFYLVLLTFKVF